MNNGGNPLIIAGLTDEWRSHRNLELFFLSVAFLGACNAFHIWNEIGRTRLDVALQNLDNYRTTKKDVTCKRHPFLISV